jgi:type I restriction enzyme S subunit
MDNVAGNAQPNCNASKLGALRVPVAPAIEQERLVDKVQQLERRTDLARERLAKVPKILKAFRQSVLAAACSGRLTEGWRDSHHAPQWDKAVLKNLIVGRPRNGLSVKAVNYETNIRSLTLTATTSGRFEPGHFKYLDVDVPTDSHLWLKRGDILLQRGNTEEYVGVAAVYEGAEKKYIYPDLMIKIHPKKGVLSNYLWMALSAPEARQYFRNNATGSQGSMPKINQTIVEDALIPLPSTDEQYEIVRCVQALFGLAEKIEERVAAATNRAETLTQVVLAKAFRGELVPTEAELARREGRSYEAAAVLLERVRSERSKAVGSRRQQKSVR